MAHGEDVEKLRAALLEFVHTIGNTGGVFLDAREGMHAPVVDPEWFDLGEAYMTACPVLGIEPLIAKAPTCKTPGCEGEQTSRKEYELCERCLSDYEYEGACDSIASRREDHQRDE